MDSTPPTRAAAPFRIAAWVAIVAAGVLAAATAHRPTQVLIWLVAYLVLVAGVGQYVLGTGQARLGAVPPSATTVRGQWLVLNLGHAGVITGSLLRSDPPALAGTVLYLVAVAWFGWRMRRGRGGALLLGYRLLVLALLVSSLIGLGLSVARNGI